MAARGSFQVLRYFTLDGGEVIERENWPVPYMPVVALVLVVGNIILGEVRRAVIIAIFSVVVITIGTLIGNAVAKRAD